MISITTMKLSIDIEAIVLATNFNILPLLDHFDFFPLLGFDEDLNTINSLNQYHSIELCLIVLNENLPSHFQTFKALIHKA